MKYRRLPSGVPAGRKRASSDVSENEEYPEDSEDFTAPIGMRTKSVKVGIVMGSTSDWPTMKHAADILTVLDVAHETRVVSAHRTPDLLFAYAEAAEDRGLDCIIAGAGGAAHLPGMLASKTIVPVLGVPVKSRALNGLDSLLSIVQMPGGIPVGTFAIGDSGAKNAALYAATMIARGDDELADRLRKWRAAQQEKVLATPDPSVLPEGG